LCCWIKAWEVADSTVMRKWKWLSVNGIACKGLVYNATEFFWNCSNTARKQRCARVQKKYISVE
jgi:hypothetical protein